MKTQYYTACSLDGFIATDDHSLDWLFPLGDIADTGYAAFFADVGALAMGASTYAWMLRHVVRPASGAPGVWPYVQPAWVFTTRDWPIPDGADVRFVRGDVRPVHAAMVDAAGSRHRWLVGGGELVGQFHDAGLLDEIIVQVGSVTLGSGRPLLPRRIDRPSLTLTSARAIGPGFAELRYDVPEVDDPHDLARFVDAQRDTFAQALAELDAGRKRTHWIWYVLPQLAVLGRSAMARRYGLAGADEACAYLAHPVLGPRLHACADALLRHAGRASSDILGEVDAMKLRSCATLFAQVSPDGSAFHRLLDAFDGGRPDPATLGALAAPATPAAPAAPAASRDAARRHPR